jgi:ELWxxDGT repeat protein
MLCRYDYDTNQLRVLADIDEDAAPNVRLGDNLLLADTKAGYGRELCRYVPGATATEVLADLCPGPEGSDPAEWFKHEGRVYFSAHTPETGRELWVTDGTPEGTRLVADIAPGGADSNPYGHVAFEQQIFFRAYHPAHGDELWVLDPAEGSVALAADTNPGPASGAPYNLVAGKDRFFYSASDGIHGEELWSLRATEKGWTAALVADIVPGAMNSAPHKLQWVKQRPDVGIFVCTLPDEGDVLFRLDAAPGATPAVRRVTTPRPNATRKETEQ